MSCWLPEAGRSGRPAPGLVLSVLVSTSLSRFWVQALKGQADIPRVCCRPGLLVRAAEAFVKSGTALSTTGLQTGSGIGWVGVGWWCPGADTQGCSQLCRLPGEPGPTHWAGGPCAAGPGFGHKFLTLPTTFLFQDVCFENSTCAKVSVLLSKVHRAGPVGIFCREGNCPWF